MYKLKNHKTVRENHLEIFYENREEFWRNFDSFLVQNSSLTWISVSYHFFSFQERHFHRGRICFFFWIFDYEIFSIFAKFSIFLFFKQFFMVFDGIKCQVFSNRDKAFYTKRSFIFLCQSCPKSHSPVGSLSVRHEEH